MNLAYNLDCLEALGRMPDKCIDLAVVDPPYFDGPNKRGFYGSKQNKYHTPRVIYPKTDTWEIPGKAYFEELFRVSRQQIIWGCNYFDYPFSPGRIVWDKCNGANSFSDCEIAFCSLHDSVRLFRYMWNGMCQGKSVAEGHIMQGDKTKNEVRIHPTQKPVALYAWIFSRYAKPGDLILDTHLGSGSSRIAAWDAGLDFIGYELDKGYFDAQEKRFAGHTAQLDLFHEEAAEP